jgi:Flp pilus assembly protein CpaB
MKRSMDAIRYSGAGLFVIGAVLLAGLAGLTVYSYLAAAAPTAEVVQVTRDLPPGAEIAAADLSVTKIPKAAVPAGAIQAGKVAVGRRVRLGLAQGDILREQHLTPQGAGDVPQKLSGMGEAYKAVMLPGELVPALERLIPGDKLELTSVLPVEEEQRGTTIAMPLGVATVLEVRQAQGQTDRSIVLVALKAEDVSKLALTMRSGTLQVAVQGKGQEGMAVAPLRLDELVGQKPAGDKVPAPKR